MTVGYFIFAIYAISIIHMHYRGKVRFPVFRQILTHTNYLAPYNLLMDLFSRLPNHPIFNADEFDDLRMLRDNWQVIREEALQLAEDGSISVATGLNDFGFNSFFRAGWKRFYLKWYDDYFTSASQKCSQTIEILKRTTSIKAAMFASLPPGGSLMPHRDPYAGSLRYHLGLATPNDDECYILVDGIRHSWRDGEDVLFDETFIHEAHNKTDQPRIILFCDVHRSMRLKLVDKINHFVSDKMIKTSATQNDESEKIGLLNKAFEKFYNVRVFSQRIKRWNRPIYKTLKYTLFFALIYVIFFS